MKKIDTKKYLLECIIIFLTEGLFLYFPSEDLGVIHKSCLLTSPEAKSSSGNTIGFVSQRHGLSLGLLLSCSVPLRKLCYLFPSQLSHQQTGKNKTSFTSYRMLGRKVMEYFVMFNITLDIFIMYMRGLSNTTNNCFALPQVFFLLVPFSLGHRPSSCCLQCPSQPPTFLVSCSPVRLEVAQTVRNTGLWGLVNMDEIPASLILDT